MKTGCLWWKSRFTMTLVFDHRIVDGAPAAKFLRDLKEIIEMPCAADLTGGDHVCSKIMMYWSSEADQAGMLLRSKRPNLRGKSVALAEKESLGGVCLNWGCIPTKSLAPECRSAAKPFHGRSEFGVKLTDGFVRRLCETRRRRSRAVSARLVSGIEYLMKKNKITVIQGFGEVRFIAQKEVETCRV